MSKLLAAAASRGVALSAAGLQAREPRPAAAPPPIVAVLPAYDLSATPKVALDGVSLWPGDNFHPSNCITP